MHEFRVWAPAASSVDLQLGGRDGAGGTRRVPMSGTGGGWWTARVPDAGHGTDYGFSLDGADPLPDPRSPWQPHGVHGLSRVFAPHAGRPARPGTTPYPGRAVLGGVFYELHVGTFTPGGTLDSAIDRLDHLVDLGVDVVEPLPLAAFDGPRGWGYDGVALYAVHEPYGGPAALHRFVSACHARGLAVCLDVVYNHLGPSGNYLSRFGPYFTSRHQTPWGPAVNLDDAGSEEVRRFLCDNALRWFEEFDVDALRLDAVHALVDDSPRHLLAQLADEVGALQERLGRPLTLIAESDLNDPTVLDPVLAPPGTPSGWGMDAQWSDDFHHAVHATLTADTSGYYVDFEGLDLVARTLREVFRHAGEVSQFRGRPWGRPIDPARHRGHRFVTYLQNHDQVGNRALGDRHPATLSPGRLAIGAALLLTSPFTPMIFMGEEWAASTPWQFFTGFPDDALGTAVRDGRRAEFSRHGWHTEDIPDPQDPATFERSVLRWEERLDGDHARILDWYRSLIALRRKEPDLRDDDLRAVAVQHGDDWLTLTRGRFTVAVALGKDPVGLDLRHRGRIELAWGEAGLGADGVLELGPDSVAVVSGDPRTAAEGEPV